MQWFHSKIASSALQAEAEAVLRTICIARDREWKNLLILTNCMLIVEFFFIYNRLDYSWEIETVLVDIHHLSTNSVNSDIKWTSRSQNQAAHDLASVWNRCLVMEDGFYIYESSYTPFNKYIFIDPS